MLCFLLFALERRNELSSSLRQFLSIDQDNSTAPTGFIVGFTSIPGEERLSQETRVPLCRIGGKCAGFRAKTVEVSGHLPVSEPHF